MLQSSCYCCFVIILTATSIIIAPSQSVAASPLLLVNAEPHNSLLWHSSSKRRDAHYYNDSNNDINGLLTSSIFNIRGGGIDGDGGGGTAKKKKTSKSSKQGAAAAAHQQSSKSKAGKTTTITTSTTAAASDDDEDDESSSSSAKTVINTAIKDPSHALGDAIRARAHILRKDKLPPNYNYYFASSQERTFDSALVSLGLSLGTAGLDVAAADDDVDEVEEENGNDDNTKQKEVKSSMMAYYQYGHSTNNNNSQNQQFVQPSTSAVIANYFLKTHGGTHLLQCILSLLSSGLGLLCVMLPSFPTNVIINTTAAGGGGTRRKMISSTTLARKILRSTTKYQLLQQTLFIAMTKHVSAIVGAVLLGARSIPQLGLRNARRHLEGVAADPVGQYLFYCSLLVVWLGWFGGGGSGGGGSSEFVSQLRRSVISIQNTAAATAAAATAATAEGNGNQEVETISQLFNVLTQSSPPWFLSQSNYHLGSIIPMIILGPILLREVISIIWVVSDVLTLAFTSSGGITGKFCQGILSTMRSILDTFMSIIIPIDQWKKADSFQRQQTLAKLVSQTSLVLELIVGVVLFGDAIQAFWGYSFGGGSGGVVGTRLPLKIVAGKIACAHLYINFLLSRRKKIHELVVGSVRS